MVTDIRGVTSVLSAYRYRMPLLREKQGGTFTPTSSAAKVSTASLSLRLNLTLERSSNKTHLHLWFQHIPLNIMQNIISFV